MPEAPVHNLVDPEVEAVRWRERLSALPEAAEVRAELERWLDADPANAAAYHSVEHTLAVARAAREAEAIAVLRRETAARVSRRFAGRWRAAAVAASLALVSVAGGVLAWRTYQNAPTAAQVYATGPGERATLTLQDGSTVVLNTRSRVRTRYSRRERRLYLEAGEAVFEVAKDRQRAFVVLAGGQSVTAHGTAFDVHLRKSGVEVALLEGVVVVKPEGSEGEGARMSPGQMLTVEGGSATLTRIRKLEQVASWREGLVFFDDVTLAEAVAEMNRYAAKPLRLADPSLAKLRLSGSFRTDGAEAFAEALELYFPVRAIRTDDASIVLAARR